MRKLFVWLVVTLLAFSNGLPSSDAQDRQRDQQRDQQRDEQRGNAGDRLQKWSQSWSDWWSDWSSDDQASGSQQERLEAGARAFIRRHDSDEDGKLSRRELPLRMRSDFDQLDINHDGSVTQEEVQKHASMAMRSARGRMSSSPVEVTYVWILDADRGEVELQELQNAYDALRKIDKNNDGKVTRDELRQRREQVASQWCDKCFDRLDRNQDGELSKSETEGTSFGEEFSQADRNNDQMLTKSEIHRFLDQQFQASQSSDQSSRQAQNQRQQSSSSSSGDQSSKSSSKDSSSDSSKKSSSSSSDDDSSDNDSDSDSDNDSDR